MLKSAVYLGIGVLLTLIIFSGVFSGGLSQSHKIQQRIPEELSHLTPKQYVVMYENGTERAFSSPLLEESRPGIYVTADTSLPVFHSEAKFDSQTGWLSFTEAIEENIELRTQVQLFAKKLEVVSRDTGAHLGYLYSDGPQPGGQHFAINGSALIFIPDDEDLE